MRLALMVIVVSVGVYQSHKAVNITGPLSGLRASTHLTLYDIFIGI